MGADLDRLKRAWKGAVVGADPLLAYGLLYRAKVVAQASDRMRVDVVPEDTDLLPPMAGIHLKTGVPGLTVTVSAGAYVLIGWENRDPERPFAALWDHPSSAGAANANGGTGSGGGVVEVMLGSAVTKIGATPSTLLPVWNGAMSGQDVDPVMELPYWMLGAGSSKVLVQK